MRINVLGPFEVVHGENFSCTPSAAKPRSVLALLALNANRVVSPESLIEELWSENPPASAATTLQTYVYQLRKLLGTAPAEGDPHEFVLTKPHGYLLRLPPHALDAVRFGQLAAEGQSALEVGDLHGASAVLREALSLWRGPALADIVPGPFLAAHIRRLEESRIHAVSLLVDADLGSGRHRQLIGDLLALVAEHPLHEGFHAQLMLALHRAGRRKEALEVYQRLRRVLSDELGLEPCRELQRLQLAVLADDSLLDLPASQTARTRVDLARPAQLPADIADFVGRREALAQLEQLLAAGRGAATAARVGVITGMAAVGKSVLAVRAAHRVRERFPDGQFYAELHNGRGDAVDPADVLAAFLSAAGLDECQVPAGLAERSRLFDRWTADRKVLLLLDDADSATQVRPLLPSGPRFAALVTSRHRLAELSGAAWIDLDLFETREGIELLAGVGGRRRVEDEPEAAATIVALCGRLPLAIRSAGAAIARGRHGSLRSFAGRLAEESRRFDELCNDDLDVRERISSSCHRLGRSERRALRLVSLAGEPTTLERAAALLDMDLPAAESLLGRLAEEHLLRPAGSQLPGGPCYGVHDLLRIYAEREVSG